MTIRLRGIPAVSALARNVAVSIACSAAGDLRAERAEAVEEAGVGEVGVRVGGGVGRVRAAVQVREVDRQRRRAGHARCRRSAVAPAGGDVRGEVALRQQELVVEAAREDRCARSSSLPPRCCCCGCRRSALRAPCRGRSSAARRPSTSGRAASSGAGPAGRCSRCWPWSPRSGRRGAAGKAGGPRRERWLRSTGCDSPGSTSG